MKTSTDPRHLQREKLIKRLYSYSFREQGQTSSLLPIVSNLDQIDTIIQQSAPEWPIGQINRIDLAILRLAVYELVIAPHEPPRVIIDEAVEIAKKFGSEKSPGFVNGVLGTIFENITKNKP